MITRISPAGAWGARRVKRRLYSIADSFYLSTFERIRDYVSSIPLTKRGIPASSTPCHRSPQSAPPLPTVRPPPSPHPRSLSHFLTDPDFLLAANNCERGRSRDPRIMGAMETQCLEPRGVRRGCGRRGCRGVGGVCAGPGALICGLFGVCSRAGRPSWARFGRFSPVAHCGFGHR